MTNQKYHRRRRALERGPSSPQERAVLENLVRQYRLGNLRAIHGKTRRHASRVAA